MTCGQLLDTSKKFSVVVCPDLSSDPVPDMSDLPQNAGLFTFAVTPAIRSVLVVSQTNRKGSEAGLKPRTT